MKAGEVTKVAFIDVETVSLANEDVVWEEAIILADVRVDDAAGPVLAVTEVWAAFLDVDPWALKGADPNSLLFSRFYERHPRYRRPLRDRGNSRPALARRDDEDDGMEYGRFYGPLPEDLVFHRDSAAYETTRLLAGRTVVGAIPWFDTERLDKLTRSFGPPLAVHYHLLDVEALMAGHLAATGSSALQCLPPYSSSALAEAVGVPKMEGAHEALPDAEWAMRCFAQVYGTEVRNWPRGPAPAETRIEIQGGDGGTLVMPTRLLNADRASDDGFYNELRDHLTEPVIVGNSMTGHQYFDPAAPQHFDPGGVAVSPGFVAAARADAAAQVRVGFKDGGWESLQDVMDGTGLGRDAAEALANEVLASEVDSGLRAAWEFPSTPVIYPGQHVTWTGPEDDEGKADTRSGVVRRILPDDPLGPVAEILATHVNGGPVYVPLGSLQSADPGMEVIHPTEEIDFGPGAHQEPPGDPSRNVVPAADELLAGKIDAALSTSDVHIDFDSGLERATIIGLIAGVVAEETAAATREAERWRAEHDQACGLVAEMHAAAVGSVRGPRVGLVEDVRDLRDAYLQLKAADDRRRTPQPDWSAE